MRRVQESKKRTVIINNRGSAMMVAVIIIAILMVFTFSLLLVSYTLFASQNKKVASRRNTEAANTLAMVLQEELEDENADENSDLWRYIRCNIGQEDTWPYYDGTNEDEAFRKFDMKPNHINLYKDKGYFNKAGEIEGYPGEIELCIYWMPPESVTDLSNYNYTHSGIRLFIEINCNTANQNYVTTSEYTLRVSDFSNSTSDIKKKKALTNIAKQQTYNPAGITDSKIKTDEKWRWHYEGRE